MADKPAHLSQLFHVGEEVTVRDIGGTEYKMWLARPSSVQQEDARTKSNAMMARFNFDSRDKDGDVYVSVIASLTELSFDELIEARLMHEESELRTQSINEVLYGEFGSDWATDDAYYSLVTSIADRYEEIQKYNDSMKEGGSEDRIDIEKDEELIRLTGRQENFTQESEERFKELVEVEKLKHSGKTQQELFDEIVKLTLQLEGKMKWFEVYQVTMLYYACRYIDDKKKFYFEKLDDVFEMPSYIRSQLYSSYETMDRGSGDLKNLLSLPNS